MKKFPIFLVFFVIGYFGYKMLSGVSIADAVPFMSSPCYGIYQKFATALVKGRFEEAKTMVTGPAVDQLAEAEKMHEQIVAMRMFPSILGMSYTKESERRMDGKDRVALRVLQVVRVDPPGQTSSFGTPVPHQHDAVFIKTDSGWKIESFTETVGDESQPAVVSPPKVSPQSAVVSVKSVPTPPAEKVSVAPVSQEVVVTPVVSEAMKKAAEPGLKELADAIERFKDIQGRFPSFLEELVHREVLDRLPEAPAGTRFVYQYSNGKVQLEGVKQDGVKQDGVKTIAPKEVSPAPKAMIQEEATPASVTTPAVHKEQTTSSVEPQAPSANMLVNAKDALDLAASSKALSELKRVQVIINAYFADNEQYPPSLDDLVTKGFLEKIPELPGGRAFSYDSKTGKLSMTSR